MNQRQAKQLHSHISSKTKAAFFIGMATSIAVFCVGAGIILALIYIVIPEKSPVAASNSNNPLNTNRTPVVSVEKIDLTTLRHKRGATSGTLTFIEYSDLECPVCKAFEPTITAAREKYKDKITFVYKHFPLNIHPKAKREALAAECAGEQGKFFEYVDRIFEITTSNNTLEDQKLFDTASELGLNVDTFTTCVNTEKYLGNVAQDALEAQNTGAQGAPHAIVIDAQGKILTTIAGKVTQEQLFATFDQLLAGK